MPAYAPLPLRLRTAFIRWRPWAGLCLLAWALLALPLARAQALPDDITELRVERGEAGALLLSAAWRMTLPPLAETALLQGIAVHFVVQAEVLRPRWYWTDKIVARATRQLRLSYQPLTRRWRLVQSSGGEDAAGLGMALGQNFDTLGDALAALQRITRWTVAEPGTLDDGASYAVDLTVRLNTSQMPRPLQFGVLGRSGWNLLLSRSILVPRLEAAP